MTDTEATDLIEHLSRITALSDEQARQVVAEVFAYFSEDSEAFIRRRHREMQQQGLANPVIFAGIQQELKTWLFPSAEITERRIRRVIYG